MNLLKTSSLVLLISLCVFACKPDDEPKPNNSSNTGNNPSQNNPTTNNQTNNGTNDTIYDPNDNNKVIGYPLPLSDSCKIIVEVTNGFDITRTFILQGQVASSPEYEQYHNIDQKELKPGESYEFTYTSCDLREIKDYEGNTSSDIYFTFTGPEQPSQKIFYPGIRNTRMNYGGIVLAP